MTEMMTFGFLLTRCTLSIVVKQEEEEEEAAFLVFLLQHAGSINIHTRTDVAAGRLTTHFVLKWPDEAKRSSF